MPKVSVLLCVYNGEATLRRAIQSILRQTEKDFELIAINDGSTDKSAEILDEFSKKDSRVRVFHQENLGLTRSLNRGLGLAKAKYIARQDADDESLPRRLEDCLKRIGEAPGCLTAWLNCENGKDGLPRFSKWILKKRYSPLRFLARYFNPFVHGTFFFDRAKALSVGGYDVNFRYAQDHDLYLRLSKLGPWTFVPEIHYRLHLHSESLSVKKQKDQMLYSLLASLRHSGIPISPGQDAEASAFQSIAKSRVIFPLGFLALRYKSHECTTVLRALARKSWS